MNEPSRTKPSRIACLAALSAAIALPSSANAASPDAATALARAAVPDEVLEPMRGGLDLGTMIARFAIERIVRIDGEVVARTQLLVDRLDGIARGQLPDARVVGNLANLVQVGEGNQATTTPQSSVQQTPPPAAVQPPVSAGTVSTPNVANGLTTEWGTALAQAIAIANGDQSNRPVPVNTAAVPGVTASAPANAGSAPALPGAAPGGDATAGGAAGAAAGAATARVAPAAVPTVSITVPIGSGRIVVSGIPNGPALATSIQNSVQATRIETETRIDASLASLSALRSMNFAAALRQQAIEAATR